VPLGRPWTGRGSALAGRPSALVARLAPVSAQLSLQRAPVDAQGLGGPGDISVQAVEGLQDVALLEFGQGEFFGGARRGRGAAGTRLGMAEDRGADGLADLGRADHAGGAEDGGALEHVLQLADVAWPVVALELLDRGRIEPELAVALLPQSPQQRQGDRSDVIASLAHV